MLEGVPPFRDPNEQRLFRRIVEGSFEFSRDHSEDAVSLIRELLEPDLSFRLTTIAGVKDHLFFLDVDWDLALRRGLRPPFAAECKAASQSWRTPRNMISHPAEWVGMHIKGFTYIPEPHDPFCEVA
mmetsp:Transcript_25760/g.74393  ORF Transcript_25760/g.74393 Transcript_25760/m.74393 type:complete len:127 (+) Transcript_25760:80-460(+)